MVGGVGKVARRASRHTVSAIEERLVRPTGGACRAIGRRFLTVSALGVAQHAHRRSSNSTILCKTGGVAGTPTEVVADSTGGAVGGGLGAGCTGTVALHTD